MQEINHLSQKFVKTLRWMLSQKYTILTATGTVSHLGVHSLTKKSLINL